MSVVNKSGDDVMLSDASSASSFQGLGSPIATIELIRVEGDGNIFARFICFSSEGIVNLAEASTSRAVSRSSSTCSMLRTLHGAILSPLPYDLKTGLLHKTSVA